MVAEGWHPLDIAAAYGWLVLGRPIASMLDSPLINKRLYHPSRRKTAVPKRHASDKHYSFKDKEDAVWLADHGWRIQDIAIMIGMRLKMREGHGLTTSLYVTIKRWREVVREEYD
jgi:hypothetical protein